ncbi:autotransporter [Aeromonas veronii]|uniref:autotransporter n=1 Tax=Aeromonas veronii TaxID=654 RepID=UPI003312055D|nr:autotransporter [Aeromonas veronii]HDO1355890.1 autotransporter [Aeromonas veronii]
MKKILLPVCVITGFLSPNLWAQDAFNYVRGSINWAYNKSDYFEGKGSDAKSYNGLSFDISKGFGTNFYGRGGMEFLLRNGGRDNATIANIGLGMFTSLRHGISLYSEAGLLGAGVEREFVKNVSKSANDKFAVDSSSERNIYGELGINYRIGTVDLKSGYRYAHVIDDMHDIKIGADYNFNSKWALTADYTYRFWEPQQGSITSLGIKYTF